MDANCYFNPRLPLYSVLRRPSLWEIRPFAGLGAVPIHGFIRKDRATAGRPNSWTAHA